MPYTVDLRPPARRQLDRLPRSVQARIIRRLEALADDPRPVGAVALHGPGRLLRVRVGDYRIVYEVQDDAGIVVVDRIAHRRDAYRS